VDRFSGYRSSFLYTTTIATTTITTTISSVPILFRNTPFLEITCI